MLEPVSNPARQRDIFTVSRLNREVRAVLEGSFPLLWVEGEISNLARPRSGHLYFSLKDEAAQVRCAMFRNRNLHLSFHPEAGMQVVARVRVSLYEGRGDFQLIVEHMEESGDGALRRAFDQLKQQLAAEGLFDAAHKRPLPPLPHRIGVVTSPTGAAIRDILTVLKRRFPAIEVVVYPAAVQGEEAAEAIAAAIGKAGARGECDVLIVGRGGGSLEDLQAFNEEVVARAIHASTLPVVAAVGHEIDFTIADFVADQRAPTPSAAAELLSPDRNEWSARLQHLEARLARALNNRLQTHRQQLTGLEKRLQHPGRRLQQIAQRLDEMEARLSRAWRALLAQRRARLETDQARLQRHNPLQRLQRLAQRRETLEQRLRTGWETVAARRRQQLASAARALDAVSPLATLARGYAIVTRVEDGAVLRRADQTAPGEAVEARLHHGRLRCRVEACHEEESS